MGAIPREPFDRFQLLKKDLQITQTIIKSQKNSKPTVIIFNTIKGKGIKSFENDPVWHARQLKGLEIEIGKKALRIK